MKELSKEQVAFFVGADYAIRGVARIDSRTEVWRNHMQAGFFASMACKSAEIDAIIDKNGDGIKSTFAALGGVIAAQETMDKLAKESKDADRS